MVSHAAAPFACAQDLSHTSFNQHTHPMRMQATGKTIDYQAGGTIIVIVVSTCILCAVLAIGIAAWISASLQLKAFSSKVIQALTASRGHSVVTIPGKQGRHTRASSIIQRATSGNSAVHPVGKPGVGVQQSEGSEAGHGSKGMLEIVDVMRADPRMAQRMARGSESGLTGHATMPAGKNIPRAVLSCVNLCYR